MTAIPEAQARIDAERDAIRDGRGVFTRTRYQCAVRQLVELCAISGIEVQRYEDSSALNPPRVKLIIPRDMWEWARGVTV